MMGLARLALLVAFVATSLGCADDGPKFTVNYAPGFVKDGVTVSVLGIFRDGRMNPEAWEELGPRVAAVLHKEECDVAVGSRLRARESSKFAAIDAYARSEGITDELLDKLAPAATGDSILVITIAGRPPGAKDGGAAPTSASPSISTTGRGGRGGRRGGMPRAGAGGPRHPHTDDSVFEMSASLFSKRQHQSVAMVAMTYTGQSEDEAVAKFLEKLGLAFPGAACAPWSGELPAP